ncbi:MAG: hypothetical protein N4A47_03900 [Clostridia bacterium]|nr:hypothetical protein [Clostridia bacterium]
MSYSKWKKIDLHIHTDKSKETKSNKDEYKVVFSVESLIKNLKKNEVDMISLTDHNIINEKAYDELSKTKTAYLVGVELDVVIEEEDLKKYIEALNSNKSEKIENKPFHALILFKSNKHKIISDKLESMYKNISDKVLEKKIDLLKNKKVRATTFRNIVEAFKDEEYFIIAHAGNKPKSIVGPYKKANKLEEAQVEILMGGISALEMHGSISAEKVISRYNQEFEKLIKSDFKGVKPTSYVVFSDNHNCEEYALKDFQTWIKGDTNFETLRLAFSDPQSRIFTDLKEPTYTSNYIEEVVIKTKGSADKKSIKLSPYLNVIIGGRSSGKSLLFNTITYLNNEFSESDKSVFNEIYKEMLDLDNTTAKLSNGAHDLMISITGETYYQEKIIKLFEKDEDLKDNLEGFFVKPNIEIINSNEKELEEHFDLFIKTYERYYNIKNKIDKGSIFERMQIAIKSSNKVINMDIEKLIDEIEKIDYEVALKTIEDMGNSIYEWKNIELGDKTLFDEKELLIFDELLGVLETKKERLNFIERKYRKVNIFFDKVKIINDSYLNTELTQEKQNIENEKKVLDQNLKDYKAFFKAKMELKLVCADIESIEVKSDDIKKEEGKYIFVTKVNFEVNKNKIIEEFFNETINNYDTTKDLYDNICKLADVKFEKIRLKRETKDGKSHKKLNEKLKTYLSECKSKIEYEIIEENDFGTPISTLSTSQGKKASMFLDIKLNRYIEKAEKNILIIDQVEDNIDNKYISEELVDFVRELKRKVQLIIVTHNPSIAIYGDAENIIIAENNNGEITYVQGGLENQEIRDEACKILDGGELAFKNRMTKYNIEILERDEEESGA